ncbi:MAG: hypothetical protein PWR10_644 [Halanaerobiales bacterium]|nr:hypothetical protein [Halanaerobiales bacterium]
MPEISVLMSVYNGEEFIGESIESILNQTYDDFEFIIVNDGSTDRTREIIESYNDSRIRLFDFEQNQGVGPALDFGLSKVNGKYIAKADSDDIFEPIRFMEQKKFLENNPDIDIVGSFIEFFPHNNKVKKSQRYRTFKSIIEKEINSVVHWQAMRERLYWYCSLTHTTIMGKSKVIKKVGYEDFPMGTDYNLFYKLNKMGYKMANIDKVLVKMRVSSTSITARNNDLFFRKSLYRIKKEEINNLFEENNEVYVWGAGSMGQNLLYALNINNLNIKGFIDSDKKKQDTIIKGKKVFSPELLKETEKKPKILVASQPGKFEIAEYLKDLGYNHLDDFVVYY